MTGAGMEVGSLRYCPLGSTPDGTWLLMRISERPGKGTMAGDGGLSILLLSILFYKAVKIQAKNIQEYLEIIGFV